MGRSDEIVKELREYDSEREWFEFKENWFKADERERVVERKEVPQFENDAFREARRRK